MKKLILICLFLHKGDVGVGCIFLFAIKI